ncbi:ATP-binding protein [Arundinibacter roseus]|uniref:histidine kinase n=1 Tax=Arundinibacter roseus TaxID=2070510 RepID=A0A4R4KBM8_9BACT|nr:ATP-binding protein [Arundinibacter roseus]TDB65188.1 hypothetical protein EZE20_10790 [Arundinibacter roseus]
MKNLSSVRMLTRILNEGQLSWAIRLLFIVSIFLIIILSFSYHSINRELIFYSERVDHTHDVLDKIKDINSKLHEVTYYGRGFLIMGDSSNKEQMLHKLGVMPAMVDELMQLSEDNVVQQEKTKLLRQAIETFGNRVRIYAQENPLIYTNEQKKSLLMAGSTRTLEVVRILNEMSETETKLMANRLQSRNNYKQQIFRFNWVIMGVALIFLVSAFILLERELAQNKMYKAELENKVDNLNRSNSELEQFAYVASHDLQEPLRKIRSFTNLLVTRNSSHLNQDTMQLLEKIDRSANRMQLLIDDLLAFSRVIDMSQNAEEIDLNDIMDEVKTNLSSIIREKSAQINQQILPTIVGYNIQILQLFQNLISNSLKYSKLNERPVIDIFVQEVWGYEIPGVKESQQDLPFYCIKIFDNGIGFKKEYAEKIFVIFQRLHGQEKFQGSGIGLAICRKVISNHNGYIIADGKEQQGASFFVYLPKQTLQS